MTSPSFARAKRSLRASLVIHALLAFTLLAPPVLALEPEPALPACAPHRAAIESVLASMKAAVLAADQPEYLKYVVPAAADPIFRKEQENWAKDLKDHGPAEFDLVISDSEDHPATFTPARAELDLKMTWRLKSADGTPSKRERTLTIPVVFTHTDAAGWLFAGEDWLTLEGEGVRAKYLRGGERAARNAVDVMPEVRAHVEAGFDQKVPRVQEVKIYSGAGNRSLLHLQASIYLSYTDPLGGWNEPGESIKVLASQGPVKSAMRSLLAHEFGHVATFELGPHATDVPWWILEGVAEMSSQDFSPGLWSRTDATVRSWARADKLVPWDDLTDFRSVKPQHHTYVYRQGQHMVGYITTRFGRDGRNAWLRALATGKSLNDATLEVLHLPFADLNAQWRAEVSKPADPEPSPEP